MEYAVPGSLDTHRNLIVHYHKVRGKPDMLIVIEGVVLPDRRKFRPSDWAEMLIEGAGLAHFGHNHKIHYEDDVEPATIKGCASIIFDEALERSHPEAYAELLHFATKNNLNIFMKEGSIPHVDGPASGITEEVRRDTAAYDALVH
jgi:hypothetical protein